MAPVARFLTFAALAGGAFAAAQTKGNGEATNITVTAPDHGTLYASPLVARGDEVGCRAGHGWNEDINGELDHFIADFADTLDGSSLARGTESTEWYTASNGAKFYLSVSNRACENVKIEHAANVLSRAVNTCQVDGSRQYSGGAVDYNVTPGVPTGCGHYVIFYSSSDSVSTITRPAKRDNTCATCPQSCLKSVSSCNPPEWSGCTQQEKDCVLGDANSFYSCLIAGHCVPDKEKRCPDCNSGPCPRCSMVCLLPDTVCNPPVWSLCTPTEKECLLGFAADFMGCLMAGNCLPPSGNVNITVTGPGDA